MSRPPRLLILPLSAVSSVALLGGSIASAQVVQPPSSGDRVLGLDVSAWQTDITTTEWATLKRPTNQSVGGVLGDGRDFVFIRSSRGGTTGYYDQNNSDNNPPTNTLSQRYDDPYFVRNITRATAAGMLAGSYHFSRPDIVAGTLNANGPNSGTDEADHFIQMAGAFMRPGYLLPVHDFEAGNGARTNDQMAQFCIDFSNRIYQVMGIRPAIYTSGSYAGILQNASAALRSQVLTAYPTLWSARWPAGSGNEYFGDVQTEHPKDTFSPIYGPWDDSGVTHPWVFWQYGSGGRLNGNNLGGSNTDVNVAQGNIEFVKDQMVPALWTQSTGGNWHDLANWNSGQTPVAPVQGPGQVARVGSLTLPTPRLPGQPDTVNAGVSGADDTVNLNRTLENITVTLSTGAYNIRRLNLNETLNVTGGTLDARLTGQVSTGGTLSLSGGNVTFTQAYVNGGGVLNFNGAGTLNVGTLFLQGNPTFTGASGTGQILPKAGVASPLLDLQGATRTFTVGNGSAATDMRVALPLTNGNLTKAGPGTLELAGNNSAFAGMLSVADGYLLLTNANQLGTNGVQTTQTTQTTGGSVRISGNGLNFNRTITVGGLGANNSGGALENFTGNNTWSGNVVLAGTGANQNQVGLNQIGAAAGTTLNLSGIIQNGAGSNWAKVGAGDVVLTGASPNTYTGLTRAFGGRLIIEKDGALGAAGDAGGAATGNTFMLPGASAVVAFRAPGASPGLNYNTVEWIFTEGSGIGGVQIDNLGGNNTFAGSLGLGGTVVGGTQEAYLGVSAGSLEIKGGLHARSTIGPEARNIYKRGNGTLILSGGNLPAPTTGSAKALVNSTFTIEAGAVQLKGTAGNGQNVSGVNTWKVNTGALLSLAQGGAAGAADVNFNGGTLRAEASMTAANSLTLAGNGIVDAGAGVNATFSGNVTGTGGLTKTGIGKVTFAGAVSGFSGPLTINNGTLAVAQSGADTSVANVSALSITGGGRLDLADNDLLVRTTSTAAVESLVATGRNGVTWDGANGIGSSTAHWIYSLGVASNADLELSAYAGHTGLTGAETIVRYTIVGDADLSGVVNGLDFLLFQSGFDNTNPDAWHFGDFNYSGVVDAADFQLYVTGFLNQPNNGPIPPSFYDDMTTFADANGIDRSFIPEPGGFALVATGAGMMMRRTRRRRA